MEEETIEHLLFEPQYGDLYLRFADEAEAFTALYTAAIRVTTMTDDEGNTATLEEPIAGEFMPKYDMAIDTIGVIYKPTGVMLQGEDGPYPEMAPIEGWHVNTKGEMPEALMPFVVHPEHPVRVWA
jgi:hypothetical protein